MQGRTPEAEDLCNKVLAANPDHPGAWHILGLIAFRAGDCPAALERLRHALQVGGVDAALLRDLGAVYRTSGRLDDAIACLQRAADVAPGAGEIHYELGNALKAGGHLDDAIAAYREAVRLNPGDFRTQNNLGVALKDRGDLEEAIAWYRRILETRPDDIGPLSNLGVALTALGETEEAIACYQRALEFRPNDVELHVNLGIAFKNQKWTEQAIACLQKALTLAPGHVRALVNLGVVQDTRGHTDEAIRFYRRALELRPELPEALNNLGSALYWQGNWDEAATCFRKAIQHNPRYFEAYSNLGNTLRQRGELREAMACQEQALILNPRSASTCFRYGSMLMEKGDLQEAVAYFQRGLGLKPNAPGTLAELVHALQLACQWQDLHALTRQALDLVERQVQIRESLPYPPYSYVALPEPTTAEQQFRCACYYVEQQLKAGMNAPQPPRGDKPQPRSKLKLGYLSADFRVHPVGNTIADLFEDHQRERFIVYGYSYGPDDRSLARQRIVDAVDHFVEIGGMSYAEAAERIAADEIDILVDLTGYTKGGRAEILARRPAPVQVNFWGYAGTMGAPFIDYILVDDFIVPASQQPYYAERLVHLPGCYMLTDGRRSSTPPTKSRGDFGLPEDGFVFCSFNNSFKITPQMFSTWMKLLQAVPRSVLWLNESNRFMAANLRREAEARGVVAERVVFAPRAPVSEYLGQHRLADLFLDTFPYNAHTTACYSLYAGCPVLTLCGETFSARVAGSLLHTLGLDELITTNLADYEALALALACDPYRLSRLRSKLETNRVSSGLFDTVAYARHVEAAYLQMWEIHCAGEAPRGFAVARQRANGTNRSTLQAAYEHYRQGRAPLAEDICNQILAANPDHPGAWHILGLISFQAGNCPAAIERLRYALKVAGLDATMLRDLGAVYRASERLDDAIACLQQAASVAPGKAEIHYEFGNALKEGGQLDEAIAAYREAVRLDPGDFRAQNNLGVALKDRGDLEEAVAWYRRVLETRPNDILPLNNLGIALLKLGKAEEAIAYYQHALELCPDDAELHVNLGVAFRNQERNEQAIACFQKALTLAPGHALAYNNLGSALLSQGNWDEAVRCFRKALQLNPHYFDVCSNLGNALRARGEFREAMAYLEQALTLNPKSASACLSYGAALKEKGDLQEAVTYYQRGLALRPNAPALYAELVNTLQLICQWQDLPALTQQALDHVERQMQIGDPIAYLPYLYLSLPEPTTAEQQFHCARYYAEQQLKGAINAPPAPRRDRRDQARSKLKLGYLSADFRLHPVGNTIADLFENHQRERFIVYGYSCGPNDRSPARQRIVDAVDHFVEVGGMSHAQAAERIVADEIDILVDSTGYTQSGRAEILARRPAPVQVNFWGYAGTMGAPFIDYVLVDDFIVPASQQPYYAERLVHLPGCYMLTDGRRSITPPTKSRGDFGLPEDGFVFCSFNNRFKITPHMFSSWMQRLQAGPRSGLGLNESTRFLAANLRREAEARGVVAERVVFAPRAPVSEYLGQHRLADLFLDTFPYNAHTTACYSLYAGCPVLTLCGETFPARVAGSLLHTLGLDELITTNLADYEALALALARDPDRLARLRSKLETNRVASGLFDTVAYARHVEAAYSQMWEIHCAGEAPRGFAVVRQRANGLHS